MARRPNRATMVDIVALLRARGGFPVEQVAGALQMTVKEVQEISAARPFAWEPRVPHWTREGMAREARAFFKREGRWPKSTDFRDMRQRGMGLPSWDHMRTFMLGYDARSWEGRRWDRRDRALRRLRAEGLVLPTEDMPENGWVVLQRWMVQNCKLTPKEILALPNALIRREGIEKYGFDRMVRQGHAEHIATDELGTLWRFPGESKGEPFVVVEVENKTPEPDGTLAHYFLRVDRKSVV